MFWLCVWKNIKADVFGDVFSKPKHRPHIIRSVSPTPRRQGGFGFKTTVHRLGHFSTPVMSFLLLTPDNLLPEYKSSLVSHCWHCWAREDIWILNLHFPTNIKCFATSWDLQDSLNIQLAKETLDTRQWSFRFLSPPRQHLHFIRQRSLPQQWIALQWKDILSLAGTANMTFKHCCHRKYNFASKPMSPFGVHW